MADETPGGKEQLKKQPKAKQPGPPKKVGDDTPNPLPDDPAQGGGEGSGDTGRTS